MESKYNGKLFLLLSSLTGFGFILMAILVSLNLMVRFDKSIINFVQNFETPFLTKIMHFFTYIGSGYSIHTFAFIIFIVFYFFIKNRAELLLFIVVLLGSHYLFRILKQLFKRARPELHRLIEIGGYSFPSGHATNAICIYGVLTFILWRYIPSRFGRRLLSTFCIFMVLSIGLSRIYLGVHYPSDVIAGYFAGGFWLSIAIGCFQFVKVKVDVNR